MIIDNYRLRVLFAKSILSVWFKDDFGRFDCSVPYINSASVMFFCKLHSHISGLAEKPSDFLPMRRPTYHAKGNSPFVIMLPRFMREIQNFKEFRSISTQNCVTKALIV